MFYDILDQKRKDILHLLKELQGEYYLAGGTALALQLGHRDSIDFDFFSDKDIDTVELFERLKRMFVGYSLQKVQEEENTLTIIVDDTIKFSFFAYNYPLLNPLISEEYIDLASIEDIACMKLSAIVSRSTQKDYIDLYFILQDYSLTTLLELAQKKFPALDANLILKSIIYFDDVAEEVIIFKHDNNIPFDEVKNFLRKIVVEVMR